MLSEKKAGEVVERKLQIVSTELPCLVNAYSTISKDRRQNHDRNPYQIRIKHARNDFIAAYTPILDMT